MCTGAAHNDLGASKSFLPALFGDRDRNSCTEPGIRENERDVGLERAAFRQVQDAREQERRDVLGGDSLITRFADGARDERGQVRSRDFFSFGDRVRDELTARKAEVSSRDVCARDRQGLGGDGRPAAAKARW